MRYARNYLHFIRVNTCFLTSFSAFYDHELGTCQALSLCNFEHHVDMPEVLNVQNVFVLQYDYTLFFLSLRVQFHNCQYHCFFSLLSQNACLQIFIAECSFPCVVMVILMTSKYKHRLNKD